MTFVSKKFLRIQRYERIKAMRSMTSTEKLELEKVRIASHEGDRETRIELSKTYFKMIDDKVASLKKWKLL